MENWSSGPMVQRGEQDLAVNANRVLWIESALGGRGKYVIAQ